jgi:hypothetical protein
MSRRNSKGLRDDKQNRKSKNQTNTWSTKMMKDLQKLKDDTKGEMNNVKH